MTLELKIKDLVDSHQIMKKLNWLILVIMVVEDLMRSILTVGKDE